MMRIPSRLWQEKLQAYKNQPYAFPTPQEIVPWLAPVVDPVIRNLVERWGTVIKLRDGEMLFKKEEPVDRLILVRSGITARCVGQLSGPHSGASSAFSTPGRFACGNLNFFSRRPCAGAYFALTDAKVVSCSQKLLRSLCAQNADLMYRFLQQFEVCTLSDRYGFMADRLLSVEDRIVCVYYVWANAYGTDIFDGAGKAWTRMPVPIRGEALRQVICCSKSAFERGLSKFRNEGALRYEGSDHVLIRKDRLDRIALWLKSIKGKGSYT